MIAACLKVGFKHLANGFTICNVRDQLQSRKGETPIAKPKRGYEMRRYKQ